MWTVSHLSANTVVQTCRTACLLRKSLINKTDNQLSRQCNRRYLAHNSCKTHYCIHRPSKSQPSQETTNTRDDLTYQAVTSSASCHYEEKRFLWKLTKGLRAINRVFSYGSTVPQWFLVPAAFLVTYVIYLST